MGPSAAVVFVLVVGPRFLLPLAIPYFPLPAIIACLVLDGVDQTLFQLVGHDPPGYQSYDKAMDVYYLCLAYLAMLRNWASVPAYRVGAALLFYRLVGVLLFELTGARVLLLLFPNTFEYYFIAYEVIRARWQPAGLLVGWWLSLAGLIWVVVKLPQEWWIHVARLDVTDELSAHTWVVGPLIVLVGGVVLLVRRLVLPRLPAPDHDWRLRPEPLPPQIDEPHEQAAWRMRYDAVWSVATAEKIALLGLVVVIFGQMLPGYTGSATSLFIGVGITVAINASLTLAAARRRWTVQSTVLSFVGRLAMNVALAAVANLLLGAQLDGYDTLFFLTLISLVSTLHDRWRPVHEVRKQLAAGVRPLVEQ